MALLSVLLAPPSYAGAVYTVTRLPDQFHPSDLNNAGQMSGALYSSDGSVHAAIYAAGIVTDLGTFGAAYSYANAINDTGAVAGNFGMAAGVEHAFLYQDGVLHDIGPGTALGMNGNADVVGQRTTVTGATGFLYSDGSLADVGQLGYGNVSRATAINDARQVVGESNLAFNSQAPTRPFLYENGTLHELAILEAPGVHSAMAINNAGQVAGYGDAGNGRMHVFFHEGGVLTDLGSFGGLDVTIGGMNATGQLVGTGNTPDGPDVAFISHDGALVDLNALIDQATGWSMTSALDINDHGQIIGYACRDDACSAVRLDLAAAVPEPAGAVLMLPGLLAMFGQRARQVQRRRRKKTAGPCGYGGFFNLQRWYYASRPARLRSFSFR
jgi:probable HAF family extracellular repeat protein